jgi:hypothetical protein
MATDPIGAYARGQTPTHAAICRALREAIEAAAPKATARIWHAMPVWFVGENPIVGFKASAKHVNLLFWNGQAFDEPALTAAGKFRAAQIKYTDAADIDDKVLRRWVTKAAKDIWDLRAYRESMRSRA